MSAHTALDIAAWFVARTRLAQLDGCDDASDVITVMKLQKLLYYAQGCYLALSDETLFGEELVAWRQGPIVVTVNEAYEECGVMPIEYARGGNISHFGRYTSNTLEQVWDAFGCFTASRLRDMSCNERPWQEAIAAGVGSPLSLDSIREYFERHYVRESDEEQDA